MVQSIPSDTVVSYLVTVDTLLTDDTTVIQEVSTRRELLQQFTTATSRPKCQRF